MHKINFEEFRNDVPTVPIKCSACNEVIRSNYAEYDVFSIQCPKTSQTEFRIPDENGDMCSISCKDIMPRQQEEYNEYLNKGKKHCSFENKKARLEETLEQMKE